MTPPVAHRASRGSPVVTRGSVRDVSFQAGGFDVHRRAVEVRDRMEEFVFDEVGEVVGVDDGARGRHGDVEVGS